MTKSAAADAAAGFVAGPAHKAVPVIDWTATGWQVMNNCKFSRRRMLGAMAGAGALCAMPRAGAQPPGVREVEGFRFDSTLRLHGEDLVLNGVGVRKRFFLPIYVAGLYVPRRSEDAEVLLAQRGPRRMSMRFVREVEADLFMNSLLDGMRRNYGAAQLDSWRVQIDTLSTVIRTMVMARRGDHVSWDYSPLDGARVMQNSLPRVPAVQGEDFYNAVLRVWLGAQPADVELKRGLLGG